jgi:hypothetical protein
LVGDGTDPLVGREYSVGVDRERQKMRAITTTVAGQDIGLMMKRRGSISGHLT